MMLATRALVRQGRSQQAVVQKRGMAGAFPARMAAKKNKFFEEWNGKREITNLDFKMDAGGARMMFLYVMVVPFGIYSWSKAEFKGRGDRRYAETV